MAKRNYRELILDILDRMTSIQESLGDKNFADFENNQQFREAIFYNLIVIGEAVAQLPDEIYERYPHIPWHGMRGLRNILTHEYFRINLSNIWEIITEELPSTKEMIEKI